MKLNIQKFATGGVPSYFSAVMNPVFAMGNDDATTTTTSSESSGSSEKEDPMMKRINDLMSKLVDSGGIPIDVQLFADKVLSPIYRKYERTGKVSALELLNALTLIHNMLRSKDYLQEAAKAADKNESLDDYAMTTDGKLYTLDLNGQIQIVSLDKFNAKKLYALTNQELLEYRKYRPELAFNPSIATTIGKSVGIEKINEFIQGIISKVGTSDDSREAYNNLATLLGKSTVKKPTQELFEAILGLAEISNKMGLDTIFKSTELHSSKNIQLAFNYIWGILPRNMRNQLQGTYVAQGNSYKDSGNYVMSVLSSALESANDIKNTYKIQMDSAATRAAGGGQEDERRQTTTEMFFNLNLDRTNVTISDPTYKNRFAIQVKGNVLPLLTIDGGSGAGKGALEHVLDSNGKGMGKYLDMNNVWFGTDQVPSEYLQKVLYDGDQIANVSLPIIPGSNKIDWDSVFNYEKAEEEIRQLNITDPERKNEIHRQYGSYVYYDTDGNQHTDMSIPLKQFLMVHGTTSSAYVTSDNLMNKKVDRDRRKLLEERMKVLNKQDKTNLENSGWFHNTIELPVFIEIRDNAGLDAAYYAHQGSKVPDMTLELDMASQLAQLEPTIRMSGNPYILESDE